jgi:hypothetical protein
MCKMKNVITRLWTHKTHHGSSSREATTFPHIVLFAPLHNAYIRMAFCPRTPKEESEIVTFWTPATLQDYNSLLGPPIGMRFKTKL